MNTHLYLQMCIKNEIYYEHKGHNCSEPRI